jgi:hypothetical protein
MRHVASSYWAERLAAAKFPENRENFAFTGVNQLESRNFLSESRGKQGNFGQAGNFVDTWNFRYLLQ